MSNKRPSVSTVKRSSRNPPLSELADHDNDNLGYEYGKPRPAYIDSLGEKRSDYTYDSPTGLFVERPMAGPSTTTPAAAAPAPKGKEPVASPKREQEPEPDDSGDDELPDAPELPSGTGGSVKIDGDVYFNGHPEELDPLWFHMFEKAVLDPNMDSDDKKCAYLATRFRGPPRQWLVELYATNAQAFTSFTALQATINAKYARHDEVQEQLHQRTMDKLYQSGKASDFIHEFNLLADKLGWPDVVRLTILPQRIKPAIRNHMLLYETTPTSYDNMCSDFSRVGEMLDLVHAPANVGKKKSGKRPKKGKSPKCGNCGKPGHDTSKCWAKKINMISLRGQRMDPDSYQVDVTISGQERTALVDSGAAVNCIRADIATGPTFNSGDTIQGPTGQALAVDARYIVETIGGTPQRLYLVPDLTEEVILGRPYLSGGATQHNMCAFATTGPPAPSGTLRKSSLPELEALDAYIEQALERDWIRPSNALRACNAFWVPKKNGRLRMVIDYRPLNEVTLRDGYPLPLIKSLLHQVIGSKVFSVIDLEAAFHLIKIMPGQEPLTAFRTPKGVYEYKVMPFGIKNGPSIFQRYIERILSPHAAYAKVYIDDVIIHSDDRDQHYEHMSAVLSTLKDYAIRVAADKTQAALDEVTYLGHRVTHGMVEAIIDYKAVQDWPEPKNKTELQQYMGMANYWRDYVPGLAQAAAPLYALTGNDTFIWKLEHSQAFATLKAAICGDVEIHQQDPDVSLDLFFDASGVGLGAVAFQMGRPISILSRGLSPAEKNYTTTEREMLAIVWATKKWTHMIESTRAPIVAYTDHKLLTQNWNADYRNRRMNRWLEHLMRLPITYKYVEGVKNPADAPSRRPDFFPERGGEKKINKLTEAAQPVRAFWQAPQYVTPIDKTPATPSGADPWEESLEPTADELEAYDDYIDATVEKVYDWNLSPEQNWALYSLIPPREEI